MAGPILQDGGLWKRIGGYIQRSYLDRCIYHRWESFTFEMNLPKLYTLLP